MKIALITGITGQDGSYLAEFLLEKGYEVHGVLRRSSSFNTERIEHLYLREWVRDMKKKRAVNLHYGDMTDSSSLIRIIQEIKPDEIYNLDGQDGFADNSFGNVGVFFKENLEFGSDNFLDNRLDFGVAELSLGLTFKLEVF